jgi:hypothetical protein
MTRFWVSWWGGEGEDMRPLKDDDTTPSWACSGGRFEEPKHSICAVVDADSEEAVWKVIKGLWPEAEERFCEEKPDDWLPEKTRFKCIIDKIQKRAT